MRLGPIPSDTKGMRHDVLPHPPWGPRWSPLWRISVPGVEVVHRNGRRDLFPSSTHHFVVWVCFGRPFLSYTAGGPA